MNKNKKRIIALAGVTGMILSLSCHLLDMPIRAKEASITLIKDPVYTDHDKVALFPKTQDTKEDVSVQNHDIATDQNASAEAFCRPDASKLKRHHNTENTTDQSQKQQTVMAGNVNTDADNTKNNPSTDQNAAGSTTDSSTKDSKKDDSVSTLLIPEQWNIEITNCIPTDSTSSVQEKPETDASDEKTEQTNGQTKEQSDDQTSDQTSDQTETSAEETTEAKEQDAAKKEQQKKKALQKKKKALQQKKKAVAKKKKQKRAKACQVMAGSTTDRQILERIVEAEAGGENRKGKILVANVILNRVRHKEFPNTIKGVVFAHKGSRYQFSPIADGRYYKVHVSGDTKKAVRQALQGVDGSKGALYFMERRAADSSNVTWFDTALTKLFRYGCHEFYK